MDMSFSTRPFGFDRVFTAREVNRTVEHDDTISLVIKIESLEDELAHLRKMQNEELARARADAFQAGMDAARSDRETALLAAMDALHSEVEGMVEERAGFRADTAREAAELVLTVAQHLAGHPLLASPAQAIDDAIGRALAQVARGTELIVRVHPDMAVQIEERIADRQANDRRRLNLHVTHDATLAPGDARIEWDEGGMVLDRGMREAAVLHELNNLFPVDDRKAA
ncbi:MULTISPECIES: FliH/SctL family protein [unclassified Sphingomonas]|uniref:FliH/SctL family protein n=1 Tax=unclassified Sphingomonas TaxID=196159 RepID=UPI002151CFCB|nr:MULTISPECIES: FliH/SctL family protein [unclassified Sphingomonas]MCR5869343.1 flagellar assembly protein FliH [Sphingomonas sp. J344]UUX98926.1 flagellar assembly protein FliH [Sphingomonas sp. J315]